jgi:ABC-type multidrug transport system fused ATPase/permease subunit
MTATETSGTAKEVLTPRLREFQAEVEQLKVTGGRANPERTWMIIGAVAMAAGGILSLFGWILTQRTTSNLDFASYNAMGNFGLTLAIAGTGLFVVMSLRRYFRYWLVRFIYQMRDQADRVVAKK